LNNIDDFAVFTRHRMIIVVSCQLSGPVPGV